MGFRKVQIKLENNSTYNFGIRQTTTYLAISYIYRLGDSGAQLDVSAKLRQLAGQTQDNFNFGPSLLKFSI